MIIHEGLINIVKNRTHGLNDQVYWLESYPQDKEDVDWFESQPILYQANAKSLKYILIYSICIDNHKNCRLYPTGEQTAVFLHIQH